MSNPSYDLPEAPVLTVSELNRRAREAVESQLPLCWVGGEISNFTRAASGHWYFSLKDDAAQVRCVMFRSRNQFVESLPSNGDRVEIRALATLYEARGEFQLSVETLRRAGLGALFETFERLKRKLDAEGLFEQSRKRELPVFPRRVGVVTSLEAAALHDVLTTLRRRMPGIPVIVYPTPVQGTAAPAGIAAAIAKAGARGECDVLIVCRGGGSLEDLWAFNEEVVARAIAASLVPVISGVGHETDFTIADFVADLRAPTPTGAAERAVPDRRALLIQIERAASRLVRAARHGLENRMQRADGVARRLRHPGEWVAVQAKALSHLAQRLTGAAQTAIATQGLRFARSTARLQSPAKQLHSARSRLAVAHGALTRNWLAVETSSRERVSVLAGRLTALNPLGVLERGYSIVENGRNEIVRDAMSLNPGDEIRLRFARGTADAEVKRTRSD